MRDRLSELLELEGTEFLARTYYNLLKRSIDRDGQLSLENHLKQGESKLSILFSIISSPEHLKLNYSEYFENRDALAEISLAQQLPKKGLLPTLLHLLRIRESLFIETTIALFFQRSPFPDELHLFRTRFSEQRSRPALLAEMFAIANNGNNAKWTADRFARAIADIRAGTFPLAYSIDELLSLDDISFVDCCYRSILGRPADLGGMTSFLQRYRAGDAKFSIVRDMVNSDEGRASKRILSGIDERLALYRRRNVKPLRFLGLLPFTEDLETPNARMLRAALRTDARLERKTAGA